METTDTVLFYSHNGYYGCFSNFYKSQFKENDVTYCCSEQYLMKKKQELFDPENNALSLKIMNSRTPAEIKKYGRSICNFDQKIWDMNKFNIMVSGLRLKFSQNQNIRHILIATQNKNLFEASPHDKIWGTGFNVTDSLCKIMSGNTHDFGENYLGKALEKVRNDIIQHNK